VFDKEGYGIYSLTSDQASGTPVGGTQGTSAGVLPPASALTTSTVVSYLADAQTGLPATVDFRVTPYHAGLSLAAIGQPSVGVAAGSTGTYLSGATGFYFTDMLGNRNLNVALNANGTVKDFGGQAIYQNVGHRFNWALIGAHVPYLSGFATARPTIVTINGRQFQGTLIEQVLQRVYVDQAGLITQYPFSTTKRLELNATFTRLGFNTEVERLIDVGGQVVEHTKTDTTSAPSLSYGQAAAAFVGDNSFFGFTAPITGWRYRFEAAPTFGTLQFQTALADMRRYFFARPITLAVRGLHFGRYGADAESNRLSPVFVGDPLLVRGYSAESFDPAECTPGPSGNDCPEFDRLIGSRIAVVNAELRIPLFGTPQYGLIKASLLPIDIAPFVDAGIAWSRGQSASLKFARRSTERVPVVSAGITARANLFGYAVIEAFYAKPFQRPDKSWIFGFNFAPGW
jgi:hypothetical protein